MPKKNIIFAIVLLMMGCSLSAQVYTPKGMSVFAYEMIEFSVGEIADLETAAAITWPIETGQVLLPR